MWEVGFAANAAQAQRWNGASGQHWIEHRERHLAEHQNLTPHLFRRAAIAPGERVLDVGCGCGDTTILAARSAGGRSREKSGGSGIAVGLDLSAPMLAVARHLAGQAGTANARFVRGDAQARPLRRATFDAVISNFGVMFFGDPRAAFAGLGATVRPHGRLVFLCWQDETRNELFNIPLRAFGAHTRLPGPSASGLFFDPGQITELLSGTGWGDVQVASVNELAWLGSDVDDVMSYLRGMPMIRALAASLNNPSLATRVLATIEEQYQARQRPDGIWVPAAAWLVTAQRVLFELRLRFGKHRCVGRCLRVRAWDSTVTQVMPGPSRAPR
jgi:SAM-dependent methyltransferase